MSEGFNIDIVNPEKSFLSKENVLEVIVPAFEGEMGILKDHIPIISFLKPGIIKVITGSEEHSFYVEDGIVEFKDNSLSILTSSIFNIKDADKRFISDSITEAENELNKENLDDQKKFLLNHKVEVLKSISIN
jgi:ATP synthase F1 epsilon subunit